MGKLFGTDGIRGMANTYPMTPEIAVKAGRGAVAYFRRHNRVDRPKFIIGRDTRISGPMFETALMAGICSMGGEAFSAGVLPTPGIAFAVRSEGADAGIVISASHNPFEDNGIKFFKTGGYKLSKVEEEELETFILDEKMIQLSESIKNTGQVHLLDHMAESYKSFLANTLDHTARCKGMQLLLDCSNGATSTIAPELFETLGFNVATLSNAPDGININAGCGSQHPEKLAEKVAKSNAAIGLAFDGDGDRLIAVDEKGNVLTGDQIIAVCAFFLYRHKRLVNRTVVSTVMSNIGLGVALKREAIRHVQCDVGDRYVMEAMLNADAVLGGEDSGHIIFFEHHTTGDGMLAALQLIDAVTSTGKPLSELAKVMTVFPQVLKNVPVSSKPSLDTVSEIRKIIQSIENELAENGRVLVRYSGTQPLCRVMVEAPTGSEAKLYADKIAMVVKQQLGDELK